MRELQSQGGTRRSSSSRFTEQPDSKPAARFARLPVIGLALLGAALLAFLVWRISVVNALLDAGTELAAMSAPKDPRVVIGRAGGGFQLRQETKPDILQAFQSVPLSEQPFLREAGEAIANGDMERATRLIRIAHRRNPRSQTALLLLLESQLRQGDFNQATATVAVLSRLSPNSTQLFVPQLAALAVDPRTSGAVRQLVKADPRLRSDILEQLAQQGAEPGVLLSLAGENAAARAAGSPPRWQQLALEGMVERGEIEKAFEFWAEITGIDREAGGQGVYDAEFQGLPGPAPFNWKTESGGDGLAEVGRGSKGLHAEFYGRADTRLASQLLLLEPGSYQLSAEVEGKADGEGGRLSWVISCHPSGRELGAVALAGLDYSPRTLSSRFAVPASGCTAQWLRLVGKGAEFPKEQQVLVRRLRVTNGRGQ